MKLLVLAITLVVASYVAAKPYDEEEDPAFADEGVSKRSSDYATRTYNGHRLAYGCRISTGKCWAYCGVSWVGIFNFCYVTERMMSYWIVRYIAHLFKRFSVYPDEWCMVLHQEMRWFGREWLQKGQRLLWLRWQMQWCLLYFWKVMKTYEEEGHEHKLNSLIILLIYWYWFSVV